MYFTDRGLEELEATRGDEQVALTWLVEQMRAFVDAHPEHEAAVDQFGSWLARADED